MARGQFEKIVEDVKALSPVEQRQLRAWLDTVLAQPPMTEDAFAHHLVDIGLLSEIQPPLTDLTPYQHRQPIETTGKPLSEVILEERR
jgi:hypothetical protein